MRYWPLTLPTVVVMAAGTALGTPAAYADGEIGRAHV